MQNPRLPWAVEKLLERSSPERHAEDVVDFLEFSLGLPELWEFRQRNRGDIVALETEEVASAARRFLAALKQHPELIRFSLGDASEDYAKLSSLTERILMSAARDTHFLHASDVPRMPKLPGHRHAREQFCVLALVDRARAVFPIEERLDADLAAIQEELRIDPKKIKEARPKAVATLKATEAKGRGLHGVIAFLVNSALDLTHNSLTTESVKQFLRHG
jgi:hypothetical protein